jgi:hypothetical protein
MIWEVTDPPERGECDAAAPAGAAASRWTATFWPFGGVGRCDSRFDIVQEVNVIPEIRVFRACTLPSLAAF